MFVRFDIIMNCLLAILLSALFASCKDEMDEWVGNEETRPSRLDALAINIRTYWEGFEKPATRAVVDEVSQLPNVYVYSMKKKNERNWVNVFNTQALTITNNGKLIWSYEDKRKWEEDYYYKFRAFYPKTFNTGKGESCAQGFECPNFSSGSTDLKLTDYRSADDPRDNTDLLVSQTIERINNTDVVDLKMDHILSCVNFSIKKKVGTKLTITSFKLKNYVSKGTYNVSGWQFAEKEYNSSNSADFIKDFNFYNLDGSKLDVTEGDLHGNGNGSNKLKDKSFYVEYKGDGQNAILSSYSAELTEGLEKEIESSVNEKSNYCSGLLMIPQVLKGKNDVVKITLKNGKKSTEITAEINNNVEAEIKYKFDGGKEMTATIDLTANGTVPAWEAGKRYIYTIGIYDNTKPELLVSCVRKQNEVNWSEVQK